jgi:hypothetical protein
LSFSKDFLTSGSAFGVMKFLSKEKRLPSLFFVELLLRS